jgi:GTP cyclohydrolase IV
MGRNKKLSARYNKVMDRAHQVYLGLGANLGDRAGNLAKALEQIRSWGALEKISPVYETEPVGYRNQADFLNLACLLATELKPKELLRELKAVEKKMGRQTTFRNAPRPIDIDILFFDSLVMESPELTIPHPRVAERAFVLVPLADIAPEFVHPVLQRKISDLLQAADRRGIRRSSTENRENSGKLPN